MATVGVDEAGQAYNVNADTVAECVAESLRAEKLVYLTNVTGSTAISPTRRPHLVSTSTGWRRSPTTASCRRMIPKVRSCVEAVKSGVSRPAPRRRIPHALLLEFFTREGSARW